MAQPLLEFHRSHSETRLARRPANDGIQLFLAAFCPCDLPDSKTIRNILCARARRASFFSAKLFADPAWDMLLELYAAELDQVRLSVGSLCIGSGVPDTTGLRWIGVLEQEGLIERRGDPFDRRRIYIELTASGSSAMTAYFQTPPFEYGYATGSIDLLGLEV